MNASYRTMTFCAPEEYTELKDKVFVVKELTNGEMAKFTRECVSAGIMDDDGNEKTAYFNEMALIYLKYSIDKYPDGFNYESLQNMPWSIVALLYKRSMEVNTPLASMNGQ